MKILKKDKERFGVEPITEKMVATRHRWFGNILKIPVVKSIEAEVPRKTIREIINKYLEITRLDREMIYDRTL